MILIADQGCKLSKRLQCTHVYLTLHGVEHEFSCGLWYSSLLNFQNYNKIWNCLYKIIPLILLIDSIRGLLQATCLGLLYQILPSLNSIFCLAEIRHEGEHSPQHTGNNRKNAVTRALKETHLLPWENTLLKLPAIKPRISHHVCACSTGKNTGGVFPTDAQALLVTESLAIA